ncbi:hypothetical protein Pmani_030012 [Petrolisthes manimaculis]|uniref:Uncharacterized protein n=1 Tax=Petrolisthes manimaculis TaxID=1843537 RepID=A0AAE1NWW5_9EUCA|nr:hypothetical protein Pmani_030012 [Petrolisthes manimaculis]
MLDLERGSGWLGCHLRIKQSMEATKALMNHHLVTKLELSLESECRVLLQQWTSPHFAHLCKKFLDSNHIHLQKPVNLPL